MPSPDDLNSKRRIQGATVKIVNPPAVFPPYLRLKEGDITVEYIQKRKYDALMRAAGQALDAGTLPESVEDALRAALQMDIGEVRQ